MRLACVVLFSLMGVSFGFNIDASAIRAAEAAQLGEEASHFGNLSVPSQMSPTNLAFPDGLRLLLYSPIAQNLSVEKNDQPSAPAGFVTPLDSAAAPLGSGFWAAIYNYSWSINFEAPDVDMIATIEAPYNRDNLEGLGIRHENTFLAKFDSARGGWVVDTSRTSTDGAQNRTRIIGLSNFDGEYMLVGRKSTDSHGSFIQPGSSSQSSDFRIGAPPANSPGQTNPSKAPVQIGRWMGGFQLKVRSCNRMRVNMNFLDASKVKIQRGFKAVSPFGYMVNSSDPNSKVTVTARLPFHTSQIKAHSIENSWLKVAEFDSASGEFRVTHQVELNATSTSLRVLPRAVEVEASSLDAKWILAAPEVSSPANPVTSSPSLAVTTPLSPTSAITGGPRL